MDVNLYANSIMVFKSNSSNNAWLPAVSALSFCCRKKQLYLFLRNRHTKITHIRICTVHIHCNNNKIYNLSYKITMYWLTGHGDIQQSTEADRLAKLAIISQTDIMAFQDLQKQLRESGRRS